MGQLVFQANSGGQTNLVGQNTASTFNLNIPLANGTLVSTGDTATVTSTMISGPVTTAKGGTGLTSFTANGVVYASSTSALSTGSALTFDGTGLTIGSSASASTRLTTNGPVQFNASTDTNTYIGLQNTAYLTAGGSMVFGANSAEGMRLTSTGLGIGTSSPTAALDVYRATNTASYIFARNGSGTTAYMGVAGDNGIVLGAYSNSAVRFTVNASEVMRLDTSGNLGLGVTPSAWSLGRAIQVGTSGDASLLGYSNSVYLSANAYYNSGWKYTVTGAAATQYLQNTGQHIWNTAVSGTAGNAISFTQAMTLDNSGNLLVGTTSANGKLSIGNTGVGNNTIYQSIVNGSGAAIIGIENSSGGNLVSGSSGYAFVINQQNAYSLSFGTNNTERARIDSSGNFLVGTTAAGGNNTTGAALIYNSGSSYASWGHVTGTGSGTGYHQFLYNGGVIGSITQAGTTGVLYNISSDQRLKENIVDAPSADADIDAIKVRSFNFISDKSNVKYGFIAQELVTVAPYAVHQPENLEEMMGVDYSKLVPMLVKEIQSLRARLKAANIA